jgi:hypothetical protein
MTCHSCLLRNLMRRLATTSRGSVSTRPGDASPDPKSLRPEPRTPQAVRRPRRFLASPRRTLRAAACAVGLHAPAISAPPMSEARAPGERRPRRFEACVAVLHVSAKYRQAIPTFCAPPWRWPSPRPRRARRSALGDPGSRGQIAKRHKASIRWLPVHCCDPSKISYLRNKKEPAAGGRLLEAHTNYGLFGYLAIDASSLGYPRITRSDRAQQLPR